MRGIQIWAYSYCRSVLSFYDALAQKLDVPMQICISQVGPGVREGLGWSEDEYNNLNIILIGNDFEKAAKQLEEFRSWHQIFGVYQVLPAIQKTILLAKEFGCPIGICSESPLNMNAPGFKHFAKDLFIKYALGRKVGPYISASSFILNFSGNSAAALQKIGWTDEKIIPAGYYSDPLEGTSFHARGIHSHQDFHILCTGRHTWHRGQDVLIEALVLLKKWGLPFKATITQGGPLSKKIYSRIQAADLPVDLPGLVPMPVLIKLYESCSVFVGTGRREPWGLRVNDALHAGAPLILSAGMGAKKIVNDFNCGSIFEEDDPIALAWSLRELILDETKYLRLSKNVAEASHFYSPACAAARVVSILERDFSNWLSAGGMN